MVRRYLFLILWLLIGAHGAVWAASDTFGTGDDLPPVVEDTTKAAPCMVTFLVVDIESHDILAPRMRIMPAPNDRPANGAMPCPADVPPILSARALDACVLRAADPKSCVFADMARDFPQRPRATNTAENYSRCASDKATDIGVACYRVGTLEVCGAGCGDSPEAAIAAAVKRCETRHEQSCPITGSLPVQAPR